MSMNVSRKDQVWSQISHWTLWWTLTQSLTLIYKICELLWDLVFPALTESLSCGSNIFSQVFTHSVQHESSLWDLKLVAQSSHHRSIFTAVAGFGALPNVWRGVKEVHFFVSKDFYSQLGLYAQFRQTAAFKVQSHETLVYSSWGQNIPVAR